MYNEEEKAEVFDDNAPVQPESVQPDDTQPAFFDTPPAPENMYSPGIFADQPPPRDRNSESVAAKSKKESWFNIGSFMRAACLVLVCTLFSAVAASMVIDYRLDRGDFPAATNQVVLGSKPPEQYQDDNATRTLIRVPETVISAEDIYDLALSQVVGISITPPETSSFFGMQGPMPSVAGSGFIISSDGYILTNHHVIEMALEMSIPIEVVFHDGSVFEAEVVGFEAVSDVAVLKIDATGLSPALIGDSDDIRVGQTVYAVGNPFGDLVYTMTDGIISALDRVVTVEGKTISTFQFSAAVNSGNSGGPVYNSDGEVIGIVTAKVMRGNVEGIGFAVPINDAVDIAAALIEYGYISGRPLLGITVQPVSAAHAEYFDWVVGTYVRSVNPDSAADKAGILIGDIITAIADEEVDSLEALRYALRQFSAGETTTITVWRGGESLKLTITFDEDLNAGRPEQPPQPTPESQDPFEDYNP